MQEEDQPEDYKSTIPLPLAGGCQCGAIRYEIVAEPFSLYVCHCTECQKQSASAFGMSMPTAAKSVRITRGTPKEWKRLAQSGHVVVAVFCPDCGTRLMHKAENNPAIVNIKPGSLDDTSWIKPIGHLWVGHAQPWTAPLQQGVVCEAQPDDLSPLYKAWQAEELL